MLQQIAVLTFTAFCGKIDKRQQILKRIFDVKRKNIFLFANVLCPLLIGLLIYLFCYKSTYINTAFVNFFGFPLPYFYFNNSFHRFITCWACDILWAYSLTFSLYLCFKQFKNSLFIIGALSIAFALIMELLQLFNVINGTFDILDIILEFSAILFAVIIIKRSF